MSNAAPWIDRCHFGDCRETMRVMIAEGVRVQCIITSPPYWNLRDYGVDGQLGMEPTLSEFIANMTDVFDLCHELLSDDGTLWLNMGDSYASSGGQTPQSGEAFRGRTRATQNICLSNRSAGINGLKNKDLCGQPWRLAFALQDAGWYLRQDIIWNKPNPMPESSRDRCTKAHEYLFLLSKNARYYFDQEAIKEPCSANTHARLPGNGKSIKTPDGWDTRKGSHGSFHSAGREKGKTRKIYPGNGVGFGHGTDSEERHRNRVKNNASMDSALAIMPEVRNRRSVWTIPTQPYSESHFATFPEALVEPCILAGSRPGDIVFDPFFGSGTVGQVAQRLGRHWIGCELNKEYEKLQLNRTAQLGLELV